ncbi:MAG: hypothetical protein EOS41_24665 [Mesorhizobium sp.]|uniref:hypothetical protein n=1 Tax=Mesorhizobium sp. TaxID=1871066 RepID=UPI000FE9D29B|nr:hypothetical protein [Mesorhizobium sp.]RWE22327.1 MAG: hypothetical protein EOS41_24665 [Mesorhizobium sp.]
MIRKLANLIETRLSERLCEDLVVFLLTLPLLGLVTASLAHGPESFDESAAQFALYPSRSMVMPAR